MSLGILQPVSAVMGFFLVINIEKGVGGNNN
jgi:hypothetical protein